MMTKVPIVVTGPKTAPERPPLNDSESHGRYVETTAKGMCSKSGLAKNKQGT